MKNSAEMGPLGPEESQEDLNQNNEPQKVIRRGFLKSATGAIIGASTLGEGAEVFAGDKKEKVEEDPEVIKDKEFLRVFLLDIAEKEGIGKSERGDMIVYNGLGYYDLGKNGLDKLVKDAKEKRREMEFSARYMAAAKTKSEKKEAQDILDRAKQRIKTFFVQEIEDVGHKLSVEELPNNLKKFEEERIKREKLKKEK